MRKKTLKPKIVFQPDTYADMQRGVNQIVAAIRPTLGPYPRLVAYQNIRGPELLDSGGIIARRIIQIRDRQQDVGAMYLRQMLWQLHEKVGDGTATAAVIFHAVYTRGIQYIASGGNAMRLRQYLMEGLRLLLDELTCMAAPIEGKDRLAQLAQSVCYDPTLAKMLGEIMDIVGEHGIVDIRSGHGRELEREYIEGMYWKGRVLSRNLLGEHSRAELEDAAVVITDMEVEDARDLIPVIKIAIGAEFKNLLLILKSISDHGVGILLSDQLREKIQTVVVKLDNYTLEDLAAAYEDLAVLTGARPILKAAGQTLDSIQLRDYGRARWAWADARFVGLTGGKGDPRRLRQHLAALRCAHKQAEDKDKLQERIGKLLGGSATLHVGGYTESEIEQRKELAERTVRALRGALSDGVIPGGGMALLACQPALRACIRRSQESDERAAYNILLQAVEAPVRALLDNAGYDPGEVLGKLGRRGFDVMTGRVVDMQKAGILDVVSVQKEALHSAVASAALALTTDVMVLHKNPQQATEP